MVQRTVAADAGIAHRCIPGSLEVVLVLNPQAWREDTDARGPCVLASHAQAGAGGFHLLLVIAQGEHLIATFTVLVECRVGEVKTSVGREQPVFLAILITGRQREEDLAAVTVAIDHPGGVGDITAIVEGQALVTQYPVQIDALEWPVAAIQRQAVAVGLAAAAVIADIGFVVTITKAQAYGQVGGQAVVRAHGQARSDELLILARFAAGVVTHADGAAGPECQGRGWCVG